MNAPLDCDPNLVAYVAAAVDLHGLTLDDTRLAAVTGQFALLAAMAERMREAPLPPASEPAPVYTP